MCLCLCVCACVCLCVCPAIRFHISQRIFSKFVVNILLVMTRCMGYTLCVCTQRARAMYARMCEFAYFLTDSVQIGWEHTTTHHKWQGLRTFMFTHRTHACERPCARARVIKRSLIYGRILFKFAVNILQITSSSMDYVLSMFTHRAHACGRVCERARG
jgi:hypothetical protein